MSSSVGNDNHNSTEHPLRVGTPVSTSRASIPPSSTHTQCSSPAASTPGAGQLLVSSQALRDLMELAEDGMVTGENEILTDENTILIIYYKLYVFIYLTNFTPLRTNW